MALTIGNGITIGGGITISPSYSVVTDGLVFELDSGNPASYPGSGNDWYDLVGNDDATLPNGATYSADNGGILTFSRSLSQSAHAASMPGPLTTFTAETWVKFNALDITSGNATCTITEVYNSTPINYTIGTGMTGNTTTWQGGYYDGAWHLAGTVVPVINRWYCMTVTYNGTDVQFYINGALNDTVAAGSTPGYSGLGMHIGERWDGAYLTESFLDGSIPIVRLYDRALSSAEVNQNYMANQSRFPNTPALVTSGLIQNLDAGNTASYSGSGTDWFDLSSAGNDATLGGYTPWTDAGEQSSFVFSTGYANAGIILPNTAYTKIGIFKVSGNYLNLISGNNNQHAFWGFGTQYLQSGHNGAWATVVSPVTTPLDQWVFGAVTFDNTTGWKLYLNDHTPVANGDTGQFSDNPALVQIGAYDGSNNLNGEVAVSLIYNRPLSEAEMAQNFAHYQARFGL
jgi:hypothetical protein